MPEEMPTYLTRSEAARLLRVTTSTIDRRVGDGSLPIKKFGRRTLISSAAIEKLMSEVEPEIEPERRALWTEMGLQGDDWKYDPKDADPYRNLHGPGRLITAEEKQAIRMNALRESIHAGYALAKRGNGLGPRDRWPEPLSMIGMICTTAMRYAVAAESSDLELSTVLEAIYVRVLHASWADGLEGIDIWRAHTGGLLGESR